MPVIDRRSFVSAGLSSGALTLLGHPAAAQAYPSRNVRMVVPFASGGTTDFTARVVAEKMSDIAGQRFFVENKTGAAGAIGLKDVAGSAPDGYTLAVTDTTVATAPSLNAKAGISPALFEPVCLFAVFPSVLVINPNVPANSLPELIDYAKKNPGKVNFGSGGVGTGPHLQGEFFKTAAQIQIQHVPYRGAAAALQDVIAGNIQILFTAAPTAMSFVKGGQLKLIATTGAERLPVANSVPTMVEAGLKGFVSAQWFGLLAPAKTPADIVARINEIAMKAIAEPSVGQRIIDQGGFPQPGKPAEFAKFIESEVKVWGDIIRTANVTLPD